MRHYVIVQQSPCAPPERIDAATRDAAEAIAWQYRALCATATVRPVPWWRRALDRLTRRGQQ